MMRALTLALACLTACGDKQVDDGPTTCASAASLALEACVVDYSDRLATCYASGGQTCADGDAALAAILDDVETQSGKLCSDGGIAALDGAAIAGRLRTACADAADTLAWRSFGGPHGAVVQEGMSCVDAAHEAGVSLLADSVGALRECADEGCAAAALAKSRDTLASRAVDSISTACPTLPSLIALDAQTFVGNTTLQADCLTAAAYGDTAGIELACGPENDQIGELPRGEWSEIVVDGDTWGTLCGDGSEYAFWIRPAPEGAPLDQVVVTLQGGGVCLFEADCGFVEAAAPMLLDARGVEDYPFPVGVASDDPEISPFTDWTMLYLPYCNQDVFAGGGVVEDLGSLQLPRYGGVNLRAAVRMARDYLWRELDAAGGAGYRPDTLTAFFGGFSAGSYGTLYNYHWFIDDLQWSNTVAFPDGGLAVDNGEVLGVGSLGAIKIPAWGFQNNLPPYCFEGPCSGGEVILNALAPRLSEPEQNILMLSNQLDSTQSGDAFFTSDAGFINALRQMYCDTRELPGVHWYLGSVSSQSVHVISTRDDSMTTPVDGVTLAEFFSQAAYDPAGLSSHVEEGDFVEVIPGVEPFPCAL
jgi:hypothetical protein